MCSEFPGYRLGPGCLFAYRKICHMWNKGKCGAGAACRHAHGVEELKHYRQLSHRELVALSRGTSALQRVGGTRTGGASSTSRSASPLPTEAGRRSTGGSRVSARPHPSDPGKNRSSEEIEMAGEPEIRSVVTADSAREDTLGSVCKTERFQEEEHHDKGSSKGACRSRRKKREARKSLEAMKKPRDVLKEVAQQESSRGEQTEGRAAVPCLGSLTGHLRPESAAYVSEARHGSPDASVKSQLHKGALRTAPLIRGRGRRDHLSHQRPNECAVSGSRVWCSACEVAEGVFPAVMGNPECRMNVRSARRSVGHGSGPVATVSGFPSRGDPGGGVLEIVADGTQVLSPTEEAASHCCAAGTGTRLPPPQTGDHVTDLDRLTMAGAAASSMDARVFWCPADVPGTVSDSRGERTDKLKLRFSAMRKSPRAGSDSGRLSEQFSQAEASAFLGRNPLPGRPGSAGVRHVEPFSGGDYPSKAEEFMAVAQILASLQKKQTNQANRESRHGLRDACTPAFPSHDSTGAAWQTQAFQPSSALPSAIPTEIVTSSPVAGPEPEVDGTFHTHWTHPGVYAGVKPSAGHVPPPPSTPPVSGGVADSIPNVAAAVWELLLSRTEQEPGYGGSSLEKRASRSKEPGTHSCVPGVKTLAGAEIRPSVPLVRQSLTEECQAGEEARSESRHPAHFFRQGLAGDFSSCAFQHFLSVFRSSQATGQVDSVRLNSRSAGPARGFTQGLSASYEREAGADYRHSRSPDAWGTYAFPPAAGKSDLRRTGGDGDARREPSIGGMPCSNSRGWQHPAPLIETDSGSEPGPARACETASWPFVPSGSEPQAGDLLCVFSPPKDAKTNNARERPLPAPTDDTVEELFRQLSLRPGSCTSGPSVASSDPWGLCGRHGTSEVDATRVRSSSETPARGQGVLSKLPEECVCTHVGAADVVLGARDLPCTELEASERPPAPATMVDGWMRSAGAGRISPAWPIPCRGGGGLPTLESGTVRQSSCVKKGESSGLSGVYCPLLRSHYPALPSPDTYRGREGLLYHQVPVQREEASPVPVPARFPDSAVPASGESYSAVGCSSGATAEYVPSGAEVLRKGSFGDRGSA